MLKGCDVSNWQDSMSFLGYDFVIMKASEGVTYRDTKLETHLANAKSAGCKYGFYHYARPDYGNSAYDEAMFFLLQVKPYLPCMLALDWEGEALKYNVSWALEFLNTVYHQTGIRPLIYMSDSVEDNTAYRTIYEHNYGLWVANWGAKSPNNVTWPFWVMWQYTNTPIDLDYFNGDITTWNAYITPDATHVENNANDKLDKIISLAKELKEGL